MSQLHYLRQSIGILPESLRAEGNCDVGTQIFGAVEERSRPASLSINTGFAGHAGTQPCLEDGQTPWNLVTRHSMIVTRDFQPLGRYFCIEKINILNPWELFLPVLPYEVALCYTFALTKNVRTSVSVNKATNRRPSLRLSTPCRTPSTPLKSIKIWNIGLVRIYECKNSSPTEVLSLLNISIARELWSNTMRE